MVKIFLFLLINYGISNIMVFSSIFRLWREFWLKLSPNFFGDLFTCMICLPFWVGGILSFIFGGITSNIFEINGYISIFFDACLGSGGVWLIHTLQEKLEK